jgi:hypothetical protein
VITLLSFDATADQFKAFDGIEVHYVVVNTLFLQPDVAASTAWCARTIAPS